MSLRAVVTAASALVVAALATPLASAQPLPGDSVSSDAADCFVNDPDCLHNTFLTLDASSAPNGQNPTGTGRWGVVQSLASFAFSGPVTCLAVNGNVAIVGFTDSPGDVATLARVTDGGGPASGQDSFEVVSQGGGAPGSEPLPDCSSFPPSHSSPSMISRSGVNERGDIVVVDAPPPPTTYTQCRQAGWVRYGFASHADCIDYVHEQARQKCIFERVAHGITAFRAKYGLGPNHDHAMRHCVRLYTGF